MRNSLEEIQAVELGLLKKCRQICERHDIHYCLAYGTLLGAAKYQGFIPWDDDVDLYFPADELDRFAEAFQKEAPEGFTFERFQEVPWVSYPWPKLRKKGTTSMPKRYQSIPMNWEICIDLFPYYRVADGRLAHGMARLRYLIAKRMLGVTMTFFEDQVKLSSRLVRLLPVQVRCAVARHMLDSLKRHQRDGRDVLDGSDGRFLPREWLEPPEGETRQMSFMGEDYPVPVQTEAYLTAVYGDYRQDPPESERCGHELSMGEIIWDTETDFRVYQKPSNHRSRRDLGGTTLPRL